MMNLVDSVLPAPLSPEMSTTWLLDLPKREDVSVTCVTMRVHKRLPHGVVCLVGDGKDVGRELADGFLVVEGDLVAGVQLIEGLVRVDGGENGANVGVDLVGSVALLNVVQDGTLVQVGQRGHVLHALLAAEVHVCDIVGIHVRGGKLQRLHARDNRALEMAQLNRTLPSSVLNTSMSPWRPADTAGIHNASVLSHTRAPCSKNDMRRRCACGT